MHVSAIASAACLSLLTFAIANPSPDGGRLSYGSVIKLPMAERMEYVRQLPEVEKLRLWAKQIASYRSSHPDLTTEQHQVLDECEKFTGGEGYKALKKKAIAALGFGEAKSLFTRPGPEDGATVLARSLLKTKVKRARPRCSCSIGDNWCGGGKTVSTVPFTLLPRERYKEEANTGS